MNSKHAVNDLHDSVSSTSFETLYVSHVKIITECNVNLCIVKKNVGRVHRYIVVKYTGGHTHTQK